MARAICHRVDRSLYMLERINGNIPRYMKTLSDFLFLLAKISNPNEPKIWEHDNKKRTKLNKDINKDEQKTQ
jgi:cob(I)alamin adenosyltransferase